MTKKVLIEGMTCSHCLEHVEEALKEVCGIKSVKVNLESKSAVIELTHDVEDDKIKTAVKEAGYEVVNIE